MKKYIVLAVVLAIFSFSLHIAFAKKGREDLAARTHPVREVPVAASHDPKNFERKQKTSLRRVENLLNTLEHRADGARSPKGESKGPSRTTLSTKSSPEFVQKITDLKAKIEEDTTQEQLNADMRALQALLAEAQK